MHRRIASGEVHAHVPDGCTLEFKYEETGDWDIRLSEKVEGSLLFLKIGL